MIVMVLLAGHGIRAVVRKLSIKPIVQCSYELLVCRLVGQFSPSSDLPVLNFDLPGLGCLQLGQAGHGRTVNVGGGREITFEELLLDGAQMLTNQCNLPCVGRVLGDDALNATALGLDEDMRRVFQAERHDVSAPFGDLGLALGVCRMNSTCNNKGG